MNNPVYGEPMLSSNPTLNVIKKLGSSPLFLTAAILYSASMLLSLVFSFSGSMMQSYLYDFLANTGMDYDAIYTIINSAGESSGFSSILSAGPGILPCIAMWMVYATCRDKRTGNISTAGLTIFKVIAIISLVVFCIVEAMIVLFGIIGMAGGLSYEYSYDSYGVSGGLIAIFGILMIIAAGIFVLMIIFYASLVKTINRIKVCAVTGMPDQRVSQFLIVMLWISGVSSCFVGLGSLFRAPLLGLGTLASAVCEILIAVLLSKLRKEMTALTYPPVQPVYPTVPPVQPVYQPVQPQQPVYPQQPVQPQQPVFPQQTAPQETPAPAPAEEPAPTEVLSESPSDDTPEE